MPWRQDAVPGVCDQGKRVKNRFSVKTGVAGRMMPLNELLCGRAETIEARRMERKRAVPVWGGSCVIQ